MKIYTNEMGHMINIAAMPIYGKNLKNLLQYMGMVVLTKFQGHQFIGSEEEDF